MRGRTMGFSLGLFVIVTSFGWSGAAEPVPFFQLTSYNTPGHLNIYLSMDLTAPIAPESWITELEYVAGSFNLGIFPLQWAAMLRASTYAEWGALPSTQVLDWGVSALATLHLSWDIFWRFFRNDLYLGLGAGVAYVPSYFHQPLAVKLSGAIYLGPVLVFGGSTYLFDRVALYSEVYFDAIGNGTSFGIKISL